MPAPLPRWSDSVLRLVLVVLAVVVAGVPAALMGWVRAPPQTNVGEPVEQPVAFDHRHHNRDDGIQCDYCHYDADRSAHAGMPSTELCMGCHAQVRNDSPLLAPVRRSSRAGDPLRWNRVYDLPDFVFFDHSVHVKRGVGCESCHGRVDRMAKVAKPQPLSMGWCLDCHRAPVPHLRPPERVTEMGYTARPAVRQRVAERLDVEPPTYCSACHR